MSAEFALLRIVANLHAAALDAERWSDAWRAVCVFFSCPDIIGKSVTGVMPIRPLFSHITYRTARARACVRTANGACVIAGDHSRFHACREILPHLETAIANNRKAIDTCDPRLAVLDIVTFPVFVCSEARTLLYINAAGQRELDKQTWLCLEGACLVGANPLIESQIGAALAYRQSQRLLLLRNGDGAADLFCRQVVMENGETHWVLRLTGHTLENEADMGRLGAALGLTPRQIELAHFLIAGCTMTDAAKRMGIVRGSANSLLKYLFNATGTRRQAELVGYLNRRLAGL